MAEGRRGSNSNIQIPVNDQIQGSQLRGSGICRRDGAGSVGMGASRFMKDGPIRSDLVRFTSIWFGAREHAGAGIMDGVDGVDRMDGMERAGKCATTDCGISRILWLAGGGAAALVAA